METEFQSARVAVVTAQHQAELESALVEQAGDCRTVCLQLPSGVSASTANLANRILTADVDMLVLLTGAGANRLLECSFRSAPRERLVDCLNDIPVIAGSPAAAAAVAQHGIAPAIEVGSAMPGQPPGPSWRDVQIAIDRKYNSGNLAIAIEATADVSSLGGGLEARGASVTRVAPVESATVENQADFEQTISDLRSGSLDVVILTSPEAAWGWIELTRAISLGRRYQRLLDTTLVVAWGDATAEVLQDHDLRLDYVSTATDAKELVGELNQRYSQLRINQQRINMTISGPATSASDPQAPWYNSPFMKACRGESTNVTPVWMMRQAGRYMAEYRAVREKVSFLDLCHNPQLCSEVMCTAVNRLGVDAAIIFSDLLPILVPMGCDLEFVKGDGPVIHNPVRTTADIDRIRPLESNEPLQFVMDTVTQTRNDLPADMPLIGFAGAPFTLASYMIEGGASRNYAHTKTLMYRDPGAWRTLMEHLTQSISLYLAGQVAAGAQCVQLFDSWAGCLSFDDYRQFAYPYVKQIIASISPSVPVINFATGNPALLPLLAETRAAVIGIDWRIRLDDAWATVGLERSVQGNLDPTVLLTDPAEIRRQAKQVLDQAAGRPGHIFNLGHGILPTTPVENAIALVDAVHEMSAR